MATKEAWVSISTVLIHTARDWSRCSFSPPTSSLLSRWDGEQRAYDGSPCTVLWHEDELWEVSHQLMTNSCCANTGQPATTSLLLWVIIMHASLIKIMITIMMVATVSWWQLYGIPSHGWVLHKAACLMREKERDGVNRLDSSSGLTLLHVRKEDKIWLKLSALPVTWGFGKFCIVIVISSK